MTNPVISDTEYRWWVMFPGGNIPTDLGVNFVAPPLPPIHIHKPPSQVMMPGQVVGAGMMPGQVVGGGMMPGQVVGMAPQPQTMQVTLPPNFIPGQPMQVQTPAGTIITVNAPPGATGGQVIQVQY